VPRGATGPLHTQTQFSTASFGVEFADGNGGYERLFPNWVPLDRFGIIIDSPLGAVGASHLMQLATALFYSATPERKTKDLYPELYAFHVGRDFGSLMHFDFYPPRRDIVVSADPGMVLGALNDRGITRLAIPEGFSITSVARPKELASLEELLSSAYEYSPSGRVENPDVTVTGLDRRTEINARKTMAALDARPAVARPVRALRRPFKESDPGFAEYEAMRARALTQADVDRARADRALLSAGDGSRETYRLLSVDDAVARMGAPAVS
jgi:hypothetical protein